MKIYDIKKNRAKKGFSLIELLIAIFIFVVVFLSITGVFYSSYYAVDKSRDILITTNIAREVMENILTYDFDEYEISTGNISIQRNFVSDGKDIVSNYIYNVTVDPDDSAGVTGANLKTIIVQVYNENKPLNSIKIETIINRSLH